MTENTTSAEQTGSGTSADAGADSAIQSDPLADNATNYDIEFFWDPI